MAARARVCVEGLRFEAIHYTPEDGEPLLHGHTFRVDACVEGPVGDEWMVVDFRLLRSTLEDILKLLDGSLIVPRGDTSRIRVRGPFRVKVFELPTPAATTEAIACTVREELSSRLALDSRYRVTVRVWESYDRYAEC